MDILKETNKMVDEIIEWMMKLIEGNDSDKEIDGRLRICEIEKLKSLRRK